ncbi:ATP-binding protein [Anaerolineales bacterium HSG25]|nr:ATP-binding protein [Anaerolineales bacterium HSG25]
MSSISQQKPQILLVKLGRLLFDAPLLILNIAASPVGGLLWVTFLSLLRHRYHKRVTVLEEKLEQERIRNAENERYKYLSTMATSAAHELNQPLGLLRADVSGALLNIEDNLFQPEELKPLLEGMLTQLDRTGATIDNLRNFTRGDRLERHPVNLNVVIKNVLDMYQAQLKQDDITLTVTLADQDDVTVWGNLYALEELFINLLNNAKDAVNDQSKSFIMIEVKQFDHNRCGFIVTDNGSGIPDKLKNDIYLPFVSSKSTEKGTGLGLYLSKRIVEEFEGHLYHKNRLEGGTQFIVTFPILVNHKEKEHGTNL